MEKALFVCLSTFDVKHKNININIRELVSLDIHSYLYTHHLYIYTHPGRYYLVLPRRKTTTREYGVRRPNRESVEPRARRPLARFRQVEFETVFTEWRSHAEKRASEINRFERDIVD